MTDEEKKAIEEIKSFNQYNWEMNNLKEREFAKPYFDALDTVLNLIEKQFKEIEEAEQKEKKAYIDGTNVADKLCNEKWVLKIKAKIEEIEEMYNKLSKNPKEHLHSKTEYKIVIGELQSLLEKE